MKRLIHSKRAVGFWFILPAVLLTATIFLVPFYRAFETSLHRLLLYRPNRTAFIGFDNYWRLLTRDEAFRNSVVLTAIFVVATVILVLIVALLTSGLLVRNRVRRGYSPVADKFQIFLLLPFLMTPAVSGTIFRVFIWDFDTGIANWLLRSAGIPPVEWLTDPEMAMVAIIFTEVWAHVPLAVLILFSAMKSAPRWPYEAAMLDGANYWQQFLHITLPYVRPQLVFVSIMQLTLSFRQFELIFLITGGGPGRSTQLLTLNIFEKGMGDLNLGYGNAMGILSLVLVGSITAVIIAGFSRTEAVSWEK